MKDLISVIGGGISGLSFSHYCALRKYQVRVFDKKREEGCINTYELAPDQHIETGAHTLYNSYNRIIGIIGHYNLNHQLIKKEKLQFRKYNGQVLPFTKGLYWTELLFHLPRLLTNSKTGKTVKEYYSGILGKDNYDELFRYAFQAVLCQPADDYPSELLFRKRKRDKKYPRAFTLRGGIESLLDTISQNPLIDLDPDADVTAIEQERGMFKISTSGNRTFYSHNICLSCPPRIASRLVKSVDPALSTMLSDIQTTEVESLLVRVKDQHVKVMVDKNLIGINQPFYSALVYSFDSMQYWLFHFQKRALSTLEKMDLISQATGVPPEDLILLQERQSRMPAVKKEQLALLKEIDRHIKDKPIFIASNYMQGLALEDCCERAEKEANRFASLAGQRGN